MKMLTKRKHGMIVDVPEPSRQQPARRRLRQQRQVDERRHQLCGVGKKDKVAMEQHRGAEADCVTLHGGHERTGGFAEITDESKRLALACVLAVGLGAEIGEVVSGREAVAVSLK